MSVRRSRKTSSKNSLGSAERNGTSAQKRERPPCTTARKGKGAAVRANRRKRRRNASADDEQLSRFQRTARFLFGSWGAVARTTAVIGALAAAVYVFDLKVEVFGVTFTAAETCRAEVVNPLAPLPTYPAHHNLVPPQDNQGQEPPSVAPTA